MNTQSKKPLHVLGIESSCDETAAAIVRRNVDGTGEIRSNVVLSQDAAHAPYGGVVPEIAARAHVTQMDRIVAQAMQEAAIDWNELDAVAATSGPGLIGGVIVGLMTAKAVALVHGLPLIAVNHLEGHALTARLTGNIAFPFLLLLVSGGHTQLQIVEGVGSYTRLGTTIDDALGEAFDKTAKLLGLGFPGGPAVERAAGSGDAGRFDLPRPLLGRNDCNFSFSGLKTAVRNTHAGLNGVSDRDTADLCAGFQSAAADCLRDRTARAMAVFSQRFPGARPPTLVVAGGVASNAHLRAALEELAGERGFAIHNPPPRLCTDNAAMIAWAGAERLVLGETDPLDAMPRARWPLDPAAEPAPGAGVKA